MKKETKKKIRILGGFLFFCYMLSLVYFLFFAESYGRMPQSREYALNLYPFHEIRRFWVYRQQLGIFAVAANLAGNIIGFIPFGMILPIICPRSGSFFRILLLSLEFSLSVEILQLVFQVGSFDVDDLILNTLGGITGYLLFQICNRVRRKLYG